MPEMAERDPTFSTDEAEQPIPGRRLEETIRTAMAQVKGMNWSRLARESGVSRGTMYRWFAGEQQPSSWTLGRIAKTLDVPVGDLWAAWEQRPTVAPSTEIAILRLIERLDRQDEVLNELVAELKALADGSSPRPLLRHWRPVGETNASRPRWPALRGGLVIPRTCSRKAGASWMRSIRRHHPVIPAKRDPRRVLQVHHLPLAGAVADVHEPLQVAEAGERLA